MITKPYKTHQNAKDVEKQHVGWKMLEATAGIKRQWHFRSSADISPFPIGFFFINSVKLGVKLGLSRPQLGDHLDQVHVL